MTGPSTWWLLVILIAMSNVQADSRIIVLTLYRDKSPNGVIIIDMFNNFTYVQLHLLLCPMNYKIINSRNRVSHKIFFGIKINAKYKLRNTI